MGCYASTDRELAVAYGCDHDSNIGAASFLCRDGETPVLVDGAASFCASLQARWLANAVQHLSSGAPSGAAEN